MHPGESPFTLRLDWEIECVLDFDSDSYARLACWSTCARACVEYGRGPDWVGRVSSVYGELSFGSSNLS
jgi:hypothetical protein